MWRRPLSQHERRALAAFGDLTLADVRERAGEFAAAQANFGRWLRTRRRRRAHAADEDERTGFVPEVQYGNPSREWRELEYELIRRRLARVGDLPERQQLRWAKRTNALSEQFSRPHERRIGPEPPEPEVRSIEDV